MICTHSMRHTITKIQPFIHDRKQWVGFYFKERKDPFAFPYEYVFLPPLVFPNHTQANF